MADNVIKKVIDMRKGKEAILPSIVTNPELTGEEESLKSVEINGTKFTIGGGELKLVATGSYTEYGRFNLSTELDSNKLYYVEYYSDSTGETSNVITRPINMTTIVGANQNDSSGLFSATLTNNEFILNTLLVNDDAPLVYNSDTINIYELPLTLNEEPKVDNKMKLVATGTYEKEEQEYVHYNLSQELETNKAYLVKYFSDMGGFISTSIIILSDEFSSKGTISVANSDDTNFITSIRLTYTNIILDNISGTEMYDDDFFEVYELPQEFEI